MDNVLVVDAAVDFCEPFFDIEKAREDSAGRWIVEGFAATPDLDLQNEVITLEALQGAAKDLLERPTVLYQHDVTRAIGRVLDSAVKEGKLWIKCLISKTEPDIWEKIQEGVLSKFSVRGKALKVEKRWEPKAQEYVRVIKAMKLVEVSLVSLPANAKAEALRNYVQKALDEVEKAMAFMACPKCKHTEKKEPGAPTGVKKCAKCGTPMAGSEKPGEGDEDAQKGETEDNDMTLHEEWTAWLKEKGIDPEAAEHDALVASWAEFLKAKEKPDKYPYPYPYPAKPKKKKKPEEEEKPKPSASPENAIGAKAQHAITLLDEVEKKLTGGDQVAIAEALSKLRGSLIELSRMSKAEETPKSTEGDAPPAEETPAKPSTDTAAAIKEVVAGLETAVKALKALAQNPEKTKTADGGEADADKETGDAGDKPDETPAEKKGVKVDLDEFGKKLEARLDERLYGLFGAKRGSRRE